MSYILEALKKSDQQRQQGAAPTLMSVQPPAEEVRQQAFPWLVGLAAMVFVAGILIGWLQPWKTEESALTARQTADRPAAQAPEAGPPKTAAAPMKAPADTGAALARNQGQVQPPQPPAIPSASLHAPVQAPQAPARPVIPSTARDDSPPAVARMPAAVMREPEPAVPSRNAGAEEQNVMTKAELPPAILQELPAMTVSLHAYSAKAANRLVSINDKFLQEGDALLPGLVLEQITPKDMIFRYKGFRFRQGVQ